MGEILERAFQREESFFHQGNNEKFRNEVNQVVNRTKRKRRFGMYWHWSSESYTIA